jgi:hypothetical protein
MEMVFDIAIIEISNISIRVFSYSSEKNRNMPGKGKKTLLFYHLNQLFGGQAGASDHLAPI